MLALALGSVCVSAVEPVLKADFYVSPVGSNDWSGTLANPDAQGADGPFATLARARDAVRDLRKSRPRNIVVLVRKGIYRLAETVVFGLEDSGSGDSTVTYAAYPGEKPVFSSGRRITGWQKVPGRLPGLPQAAQGNHTMQKLGDGNTIYIRGAGAGNVIRRNYVHHLVAPMRMQAAIHTDGGQRDTLIAENLIYKCTAQGIVLKLNNRAENNIIADIIAPPRGFYMSLREGPMTGATIKRNVFYSSTDKATFIDELPPRKGRVAEDRWGRMLARSRDADTDFNIYFCAGDPKVGKDMLKKQQRDGVDAHSRAVDPLFVDPAHGDFRLKPKSPALNMGIVSIDVSQIGLRK